MSEGVFLEEIKFENDFWPFKEWTKIYFNDGMRNILEFYLKNKEWFSREDAKSVAERMRINVIVGENGSGKSKLFEGILDIENNIWEETIWDEWDKWRRYEYEISKWSMENENLKVKYSWYINNIMLLKDKKHIVLLDDFFVLNRYYSYNNDNSVNQYIFDCNINRRYNTTDYIISILLDYFLEKSFWYSLTEKYLWYKDKKYSFSRNEWNYYDLTKFFKLSFIIPILYKYTPIKELEGIFTKYNIESNQLDKYMELNKYINEFIKERKSIDKDKCVYEYRDKILEFLLKRKKKSLAKMFEKYLKWEISLIYSSDIFRDILNYLDWFDSIEKNKLGYKLFRLLVLWGCLLENKNKNENDIIGDFIQSYKNLLEEFGKININNNVLIDIGTYFVKQIYNSISLILRKIKKDKKIYFSDDLKDKNIQYRVVIDRLLTFFGSTIFKLDILLGDKGIRFDLLSSGEKVIFLRFLNILKWLYLNLNYKYKSFIILIDEPDLHLHLDWQRQYIHKLIDVFWEFLKGNKDISLHFIIATHSPFILSDVPAENVILLQKWKDWYTKVTDWWWRTFEWYDKKEFDKEFVLDKLKQLKWQIEK